MTSGFQSNILKSALTHFQFILSEKDHMIL